MKSQIQPLVVLGALLTGAILVLPSPSNGQAGAPVADDPAVSRLLTEISAQQTEMAANQAVMDEKLAIVAEEVRQARLFVARGGGNK